MAEYHFCIVFAASVHNRGINDGNDVCDDENGKGQRGLYVAGLLEIL